MELHFPSTSVLPPPLTPSPAAMEEIPPLQVPKSEMEVASGSDNQTPLPDPDTIPSTVIQPSDTGLQIMTRKRSSMSVISGVAKPTTPASATPADNLPVTSLPSESSSNNTCLQQVKASIPQPPKKKKKYTPKPKTIIPENLTVTSVTTEGGVVCTSTTVNNSSSKSTKSKSKKPSSGISAIGTTAQNGIEAARPAAKPKNPSKPKSAKKSSTGSGGKSKSRKTKIPSAENKKGNQKECIKEMLTTVRNETESSTAAQCAKVPPLKLQMPKLMKMPAIVPLKMNTKGESHQVEVWDPMTLEPEMNEDGSDEYGKTLSRKKKSKGRNGNIYIGVFNRIEWMKLQNEFGFGSVNNFGTFVLQTMRRVHGDVQFWCDVAKASLIHKDLDHYEWVNGFPQAVNKDGKNFTPADITMTDDKLQEVVMIVNRMWDERQLQQQQQKLTQEDDATVLDGVAEDGEEDEDEDLDNYLENMACGQYSSSPPLECGVEKPTCGAVKGSTLTEEQVNKIWNDQMHDSESLEKFGKLFRFINSISTLEVEQNEKEKGNEEPMDQEFVAGDKIVEDPADRGYIQEKNEKKMEEATTETVAMNAGEVEKVTAFN